VVGVVGGAAVGLSPPPPPQALSAPTIVRQASARRERLWIEA
jgi:hypothetical protein